MFRKFFLALLDAAPWMTRLSTELLPGDESRGTLDPDG